MIAQAVVGINGVTPGQYGSIAVDRSAVDPESPVLTDLGNDAYGALRAFLAAATAGQLRGPVKWQFVGPVTLGVALTRAGIAPDAAFAVAVRAVRSHLAAVHRRRRRGPPRVAAARVAGRAVVRSADASRVPDRARTGHRPAVERDGRRAAGGDGRRALLRRVRRRRLAAGRRSGHPRHPGARAVGDGRRLSRPVPARRWPHRLGSGADRRADPDRRTIDRGGG